MSQLPAPPRPDANRFCRDLNLMVTLTCNARCGHCSVQSSPQVRRTMPEEVVCGVMRLIAAYGGIDGSERVVLTGGEPWLHRPLMGRLAAAAKHAGLRVGVETNAFWAKTLSVAKRRIRDSRIDDFLISASVYHAAYVDVGRVLNAWSAARESGRRAWVRFAEHRPPSRRDRQLLARISATVPDRSIERVWILPVGRAEREKAFASAPPTQDGPKRFLCPADGPLVDVTGRVHGCCNTLSLRDTHPLRLGNVTIDPAEQILENLVSDPLFRFIRVWGLERLVELTGGLARDRSPEAAAAPVDVCHYCAMVLGDPLRAAHLMRLKRAGQFRPPTGPLPQ